MCLRESRNRSNMSEFLVCFSCCYAAPPTKRRRRIDRSMIGNPTDFKHTAHIGSGDMTQEVNGHLTTVQARMSTKGGYENVTPVNVHLSYIDIKTQQQ